MSKRPISTPPSTTEIPTSWVRVSHHTPEHMTRYPYAAYGSNLMLSQIAHRCPGADIVGSGKLHSTKLRFNRVATIIESAAHFVPVGVFTLSKNDIASLDGYEGMGRVYDRFLVTVDMGDRMLRCFTYIKRQSYEQAPTDDYYAKLARGYKDWAFPDRRLRRARESAIEADKKWGVRYRYEPTTSTPYVRHNNWVNDRNRRVERP